MRTQQSVTASLEERSVIVRMPNDYDQIEAVNLGVVAIDIGLDEVHCDHCTVGYVKRAGQMFFALEGTRSDRTKECGQYPLWDLAAQELVHRMRQPA